MIKGIVICKKIRYSYWDVIVIRMITQSVIHDSHTTTSNKEFSEHICTTYMYYIYVLHICTTYTMNIFARGFFSSNSWTTISNNETFLHDFLVILKHSLQNYLKIIKKCFLVMDSMIWMTDTWLYGIIIRFFSL